MEPARQPPHFTLLQGLVFVRDRDMTPEDLKDAIATTSEKKNIIGNIVSRILNLFRLGDAKKVEQLEKKIHEFEHLKKQFKAKPLQDEDESDAQLEKLGKLEGQINTLMEIPSVKRLYIAHEVQRAVADGRQQLDSIREEIADANASYAVVKEESTTLVNALINDINKLRKEVAAKKAFERVLELDKKIEEWTEVLKQNEQQLEEVGRTYQPDDEHQVHLNRSINNVEKAKAVLKSLHEERKPLAEALTVENVILNKAEEHLETMKSALEKNPRDYQAFEETLSQRVEELRKEIAADRKKRSPDFYGGLSELTEAEFHRFEGEAAEKMKTIEALQKKLDTHVKTQGMPRTKDYKPSYGELVPVAQMEKAGELYNGLIDRLDEAMDNLDKFEEAVRGTPAHADVVQLRKDIDSAKREMPYDVPRIVKEGVTLAERRIAEKDDYIVLVSQQKEDTISHIDTLKKRKNTLNEEISDVEDQIASFNIIEMEDELSRLQEEKSVGRQVQGKRVRLTAQQHAEYDKEIATLNKMLDAVREPADQLNKLIEAKRGVVAQVDASLAREEADVERFNQQLKELDAEKQRHTKEHAAWKRRARGLS